MNFDEWRASGPHEDLPNADELCGECRATLVEDDELQSGRCVACMWPKVSE
jgi:hypothetical protein